MEIDELTIIIKRRYPLIAFIDKSDKENLFLEFTSKTQKDYIYLIWYGQQSMYVTIGARLIHSNDNEYFWHYPFEPYGSFSSEEKDIDSIEFIFEQLEILTTYKTRIIQKNNILSQTFICEIFKDNIWTAYYKHSALKTNFVFPTIDGNRKIYQ